MAFDPTRSRSRLASVTASAAGVLAWYSLPDVVRSRRARIVAKLGILAGLGATSALVRPAEAPDWPEVPAGREISGPTVAALGVGAAAVLVGGTVWSEKAIFARGERRRAAGVVGAHTRPALLFAAATAAIESVDWPAVVRARARR